MIHAYRFNKDKKALCEQIDWSKIEQPKVSYDHPDHNKLWKEYEETMYSHVQSLRQIDTPYEDWGEGELVENKDFIIERQMLGLTSWVSLSEEQYQLVKEKWDRDTRTVALPILKPEGENRNRVFDSQVKSIDVYSIHDRLRKDNSKEGKELWNYVKKLNEALTRQQQLTGKAISKGAIHDTMASVERHLNIN